MVDVVDSKSTASDGVPVRVRPPAPARRELRKFATTFYASHEKSSLTCSAAPRFKTVTASLGHSFVLPTWKLIHRVHMTRKTSFCPLGQKLVFSSEACLTAREAALRAVKVLRREVSAEVCGTLPVTSCKARSFTLRNAQTFTPASPGHLPGRGRALAARRGLLAGREAFLRRILLPQALASLLCLLAT